MESLDQLLARVENLPTLPEIHLRIARALEQEYPNVADVSRMLSLDPVLSGRVIRMANSALFGGSGRTGSVKEAILRIGTLETRNVVITAAVMNTFDRSTSCFDLREFWKLAIASALLARQIGRDLRFREPEQAYLAGLVHCLGEAILALYFPDRFARAIEDARSEECALVEAVWAEFGFTHPGLCARVLEKWNFSPEIVEAVEYQLDPGEAPNAALLASVVFAADRICRDLGVGPEEPGGLKRAWLEEIPEVVRERLADIGFESLEQYVEQRKQQLDEVTPFLEAAFAS
jgi:HD-like signal output (HDOD) protein